MRKKERIWLVAAASLVAFGVILFALAMMGNHWDFSKLNTVQYEINQYEVNDVFDSISVHTTTANICFVPSDGKLCKVDCYEQEKMKHSVTVQNGTLCIAVSDAREWYDHINFVSIGVPEITIYLPRDEYASLSIRTETGDVEIPDNFYWDSIDVSASTADVKSCASASGLVKIRTSTGDIYVEDISAGALELVVSTGDVVASSVTCEGDFTVTVSTGKTKLKDVVCNSYISTGSTGDLSMKNVIAADLFSIERSTGDVSFEACDAGQMIIKMDTGDVTGSLLTDKVFIVQTDTGDIEVPKTVTGGKCQIETGTGDVEINIS